MRLTDQNIIEDIRNGGEVGLIQIYKQYRSEFLSWSNRNFNIGDEASADLFQDTIINLRKNIVKGNLTNLTSSLKTYLFAIGKNLALTRLKKDSRMIVDENFMSFQVSGELSTDTVLEVNDNSTTIRELMKSLGEPCYSILKLFYYDNFSMESIAIRLSYKNENVVKSQKLRCINSLKKKLMLEKTDINE